MSESLERVARSTAEGLRERVRQPALLRRENIVTVTVITISAAALLAAAILSL